MYTSVRIKYNLILVAPIYHIYHNVERRNDVGKKEYFQNQDLVPRDIHLLSASVAAFTLFRDLILDLCIMLLLRVSPRVDALIELRRLLRSNDRKIATGGTSTSAGFFLKKKHINMISLSEEKPITLYCRLLLELYCI